MNKRFKLSAGLDLSVTVDVDLEKLTPDLAKLINDFWSGSEDVLDASNGDIVEAAVRRAAPYLMGAVLDGYNCIGAQAALDKSEGWPPNGEHGIRIVDYDIPDMESAYLEVEEIAA